jgi:hypothetical protein
MVVNFVISQTVTRSQINYGKYDHTKSRKMETVSYYAKPCMGFLCTQFQNGSAWQLVRLGPNTWPYFFYGCHLANFHPQYNVSRTSNWHMPKFGNSLHLIFSSIWVVNFNTTQAYCCSMGGRGRGGGKIVHIKCWSQDSVMDQSENCR